MDTTEGEALHRTFENVESCGSRNRRRFVDFSTRHLPSCLRCAACLSPHHGKKERWWAHKSCQTRIEGLGKTSWTNILAEKVLNMCLILADFEIFWVCVGGSVSFVLRFWKTMELRITSTTLDPHSDSVWPRTRACRPCDEGWCPWKQHFGVVNFLVFGFRDWINWILIVIIFFFVILKNLLAHQGTSGRATDFLQRPNFHRPRRTHLAWIGVPGTTSQLDSVCTSKIQFRLNTFLCQAVKQHLDPWTSCACSFPMKLKQLWLSWFAIVGNRKSFWVHKCSQCFTTRTLLHFGLSSWVPDFKP